MNPHAIYPDSAFVCLSKVAKMESTMFQQDMFLWAKFDLAKFTLIFYQ